MIRPELGRLRPASNLSNVDFPAPLGPMRTVERRSRSTEIESRTGRPRRYENDTSSTTAVEGSRSCGTHSLSAARARSMARRGH